MDFDTSCVWSKFGEVVCLHQLNKLYFIFYLTNFSLYCLLEILEVEKITLKLLAFNRKHILKELFMNDPFQSIRL